MDAQILNAALKMGGPSCLRKTLGDLTGISFGHFMVADFHAVVDLTRTVGGVEVCVNEAIDGPDSRLRVPAGNSTVQGEEALAFLRTRHAFSDASDLARIAAQQGFLSSLVRRVTGGQTLANIPKLYSIADTVTKSVTIDRSLAKIPALLQLAGSRASTLRVSFVIVPYEAYIYDDQRVQPQEGPARQLFAAIVADRDISKSVTAGTPEATTPATPGAPASEGAPANPVSTGSSGPAGTAARRLPTPNRRRRP